MKKIHVLCIFALLPMVGCSSTPHKAFKIDKSELFHRVKTVGVMPVYIQIDVNDAERRKEEFETVVINKLEQCGFSIIPSSQYEAIYEPMKKTMGPMYDPNTGELQKEKMDTLLEHAKREYLSKHRVDALVFPAIVVVEASWNVNEANWHGTTEPSTGKKGFWAFMTAPNAYGTLPALSFRLKISSVDGEDYFVNYGGIQLCSWVSGRSFAAVPKHLLLAEQGKNVKSVDIAFKPIFDD